MCVCLALVLAAVPPGESRAQPPGGETPQAGSEDRYRMLAGMILKEEVLDSIYDHGSSVATFMVASAIRKNYGRDLTTYELVGIRNAVEKALRAVVAPEQLETALAPICRKHFQADELEDLIRSFEIPAETPSLKMRDRLLEDLAGAGEAAIKANEETFVKVFLEAFEAEFETGNLFGHARKVNR